MSPRLTDHQYRRDMVLGIVVGEYIKTITPISSGFIAKNYGLDLSSATIRNILAELEEWGYLTHPHTSAGRIPTQLGYRYYVDNLLHEIQLLEEEKKRITEEYQVGIKKLEALLDKTSEVISDLTQYTSIISIDGENDRIFCKGTSYVVGYPELQNIQQIQNILSALEQKERILALINRDLEQKVQIYIGNEIASQGMEVCSLAISRFESKKGPSGRIAILGPTRMNYSKVISTLDYVSELIEELL